MTDSVTAQVRDVVSDLFNITVSSVSAESSPDTIEGWDSMQQLNLVLALEQRFDIQIAPEEIEQMKDVGKIEHIVNQKIATNVSE